MLGRFDFNTVAMASLAVIFVVFSLSLASDGIYHQELEEFGYPVEVVDAAPSGGGDEPAGPESVLPLLASADVGAGESVFRKCSSCHDTGDANKVGPGLGGIINRAVASHPGYGYSGALQAHAAEAPEWSYEELNGFLWKPKDWVPGTSMGFAGLSSVQDRANVIAYLRTISGEPPLPTEEEIAAATATEEVAEDATAEAATDGEVPAEPGGDGSSVAGEAEVETDAAGATDATANGAVGDAGTSGAPLATDTVEGQGVPGNEVAPDSVVDPDDLQDRGLTSDDDPAAAVTPEGQVIDDAVADDAAAAGVPVAPLPGDEGGEIEAEAVEDAADPTVPVAPGTATPEVEGVIVDPDPDAAVVVVPNAGDEAAAPNAAPDADEGTVRTFRVPIE